VGEVKRSLVGLVGTPRRGGSLRFF
jgi:hypothetical protein